jgi:hypothetical protein
MMGALLEGWLAGAAGPDTTGSQKEKQHPVISEPL